jgi:hypothetical protein
MAYALYCIHEDRASWVQSLRGKIGEVVADYGDTVQVFDGLPAAPERNRANPEVTVYLGSPAGAASAECRRQVSEALADRLLVLPIVDNLDNFAAHTPESLRAFNGMKWEGDEAPSEIVHFVLEALGLEERQRLVFLSHRRSDALALAEQLHDQLIKSRFWPFVDRFDIEPAEDVQQRIYATLEETAFVVLVESPAAALSKWVLKEVNYAVKQSLGMLIVNFPDTNPLPQTEGYPRFYLDECDLVGEQADRKVLTADALRRLVHRIEAIHAHALVRRRRRLVARTRSVAEKAGFVAVDRSRDVLLLTDASPGGDDDGMTRYLVHFVPRPPRPEDLYAVDTSREGFDEDSSREGFDDPPTEAVLVHATSRLSQDSSDLLDWCLDGHNVRLITDLRVGEELIHPAEGRER